jgi:hypothetical protein
MAAPTKEIGASRNAVSLEWESVESETSVRVGERGRAPCE